MIDNFEVIKNIAIELSTHYKQKQTKRIKKIIEIAKIYHIDTNLIIGIYLIEKKYRPIYIRLLEYSFLLIEWILNIIFKRPIRNFTLGPFQIGVTSIMISNNITAYDVHDKKIDKLGLKELLYIYEQCGFINNLCLCCNIVNPILFKIKENWGDIKTNYGRVGEMYNGKVNYGVLLYELTQLLD